MGAVIVLSALLFVAWRFLGRDSNRSMVVPYGAYAGTCSGLQPNGESESFSIWNTDKGVFALLSQQGCSITPVSKDGRFYCGALKFIIVPQAVSGSKFDGAIIEEGSGRSGVFRLERLLGG